MNDVLKALMLILIIAYIISPVDFVPGPIDDIILLLFSFATSHKRISG